MKKKGREFNIFLITRARAFFFLSLPRFPLAQILKFIQKSLLQVTSRLRARAMGGGGVKILWKKSLWSGNKEEEEKKKEEHAGVRRDFDSGDW